VKVIEPNPALFLKRVSKFAPLTAVVTVVKVVSTPV
jgi:hypothetical protein